MKNGYTVVKNVISKEICDLVCQYAIFDELQNFSPDVAQVIGAHSKYADPLMESILLKIQSVVEAHTKLHLYPTYSFYRVYRNGDELKIHKDRSSCEISATLCFGYNYKEMPWPIYMNNNSVSLNAGDMVIYKGCELDHWRKKLTIDDAKWHIQGFFHYVDSHGQYKDYKYDKRNYIGETEKNNKTYNIPKYITYTN